MMADLTNAARDVLAERRRQVEAEGWMPDHDDAHGRSEMARAAMAYCQAASLGGADTSILAHKMPSCWPWSREWWKPKNPRADLVRAGALILAEIERIDRADAREPQA